MSELNNGNFILDIILFHPYDYGHWGFDCMGGRESNSYSTSNDEFYLKYLISRIGSYRNIWFNMANEFNLIECKNKSLPNKFPIWDDLFNILIKYDPYNQYREKSIHQYGDVMYNYSQPWTTHFSVQLNYILNTIHILYIY